MLGGNRRHSGVMCEGSPYIYLPSKIAVSQSNSSGIENGIKVCPADMSWGGWVLPVVLYNEVQCLDIRGYLPRVVFSAETLPLDQELEPCKRTPLFPPLNTMTTLQSYLSLFTSDT